MNALWAKARCLLGNGYPAPIFVVGTGRSGTHWVGHILEAHPAIQASIEEQPMFDWVTAMALDPSQEAALFPRLIRAYRSKIFRAAPRHYLDKSHANLWLAEALARALPAARFVGIERNPFATIASMLKHGGILQWQRRWREFPLPNRFLGIDDTTARDYDGLPVVKQCALRWIAHRRQMGRLRASLGVRLTVLHYEELIRDTPGQVEALGQFLHLQTPPPVPPVKAESLDKWRRDLSPEQIEQIREVVGFGPEESAWFQAPAAVPA
jgi:hypothetical protein